MPSELSMESILSAINDLKAEVAGLTTGLHAAEERIARLEAAAYTPPSSPSTSDSLSDPLQQDPTAEAGIPDRSSPTNGKYDEYGSSPGPNQKFATQTTPKRSGCLTDSPCDIQQHLKPVNESLAAIAKQLSRIELVISHPAPSNPPAPTGSLCSGVLDPSDGPQAKPTPSKEAQEIHGAYTTHSTVPLRPSNLRNSLESSIGSEAASESLRPIFGHPSTPSRRVRSVNVAGSPFGNYSDERSPFSQLGPQGVNGDGGLNVKLAPFNFAFNGLKPSSQTAAGHLDRLAR